MKMKKEELGKIPIVRRVLSEKRKFLNYRDNFSLDEFKSLVNKTERLVRDYRELDEVKI